MLTQRLPGAQCASHCHLIKLRQIDQRLAQTCQSSFDPPCWLLPYLAEKSPQVEGHHLQPKQSMQPVAIIVTRIKAVWMLADDAYSCLAQQTQGTTSPGQGLDLR